GPPPVLEVPGERPGAAFRPPPRAHAAPPEGEAPATLCWQQHLGILIAGAGALVLALLIVLALFLLRDPTPTAQELAAVPEWAAPAAKPPQDTPPPNGAPPGLVPKAEPPAAKEKGPPAGKGSAPKGDEKSAVKAPPG